MRNLPLVLFCMVAACGMGLVGAQLAGASTSTMHVYTDGNDAEGLLSRSGDPLHNTPGVFGYRTDATGTTFYIDSGAIVGGTRTRLVQFSVNNTADMKPLAHWLTKVSTVATLTGGDGFGDTLGDESKRYVNNIHIDDEGGSSNASGASMGFGVNESDAFGVDRSRYQIQIWDGTAAWAIAVPLGDDVPRFMEVTCNACHDAAFNGGLAARGGCE